MTDQADDPYRVKVTSRSVRRTSGLGSDTEYHWQILSPGQSEPLASSGRYYNSHKEALEAGNTRLAYLRSTKPRRKKRPRDTNQLAKLILDIGTSQVEDREPTPKEQGKDPAAVSLGKRGGLKGGKARAATLSAKRGTEIAKAAAKARWAKS